MFQFLGRWFPSIKEICLLNLGFEFNKTYGYASDAVCGYNENGFLINAIYNNQIRILQVNINPPSLQIAGKRRTIDRSEYHFVMPIHQLNSACITCNQSGSLKDLADMNFMCNQHWIINELNDKFIRINHINGKLFLIIGNGGWINIYFMQTHIVEFQSLYSEVTKRIFKDTINTLLEEMDDIGSDE